MRAWVLDDFKGLDCLRIADVENPAPAEGEVLVRLQFAALNPADRFLAENLYPARPKLPHILGRDGMGVVQQVGGKVKEVRTGQRVCILRGEAGVTAPGTFAQYVVVPEDAVAEAPPAWSDQETAAGALVFLTAHQALTQWDDASPNNLSPYQVADPPWRGGIKGGRCVLITGISGGVGLAALQLAKTYGHRVIGTTRGNTKAAKLQQFGADLLIDPGDPELRAKVKDFTSKKGVDLVIDNIGGELFNVLMDVMAYGGKVSVVGMLGGLVPGFNTAKLLFKRIRIGGVLVSDYVGQQARQIWPEIVARLDRAGQRPVVDSVFKFERLRDAFDKLAAGPMGKVLLQID